MGRVPEYFIILILGIFPLWAQANWEKTDRIFQVVYEQEYKPLMCSDNIFKFINTLKQNQIDISDITIVEFHHRGVPYIPIQPKNAKLTYNGKTYSAPRWTFHVFAIKQDTIYDMDFSEDLRTTSLTDYMKIMWSEEDLKEMVVQTKPAATYQSSDTFGVFKGPSAQVLTVSEFVTAHTKTYMLSELLN